MIQSKWASRGRRRLRIAIAATGIAAACLTVIPAASASAATVPGAVWIENGAFNGSVLCASAYDQSVWLQSTSAAVGNPYCEWMQMGPDSQFSLLNVGKYQVMAYTGGNEGAVVMEQPGTSSLGSNAEQWSWGGEESWGAYALQSYYDSGQNVDAMSPAGDFPRTDPVHTRGWRHGYQRELTWNKVAAQ
ncbi:hypothetical protein ACIGXM_32070 [Kitasatospora sp. NPDC052896]|uniref:hypothetical protein n=1 Tax=Kitasatospora sp. NPDC052896 TaxID=3364061 RepID=UPI0037C9C072